MIAEAYQKIHNNTFGRIGLHIILWTFFYGAIYYIGKIELNSLNDRSVLLRALQSTLTTMLLYYPLVYFIWPRLWMKKKYVSGILSFLALIILYALAEFGLDVVFLVSCNSCMEELKQAQPAYYRFLHNDPLHILAARVLTLGIVYQIFVFLAFPVGIKLVLEFFIQRIQTLQLKNENIQLQLNFLKAQVNPHFLFNTLNNIYSLIMHDKKMQSAETVTRLSTFMRYTLYDCDGHANAVVKEIGAIKDYIALEQIRLNNTIVNFTYEIDRESYTLPPLLFMPVVENAFKFCTEETGKDSWIFMNLQIKSGQLKFSMANTYGNPKKNGTYGGIGLQNLQKRLEHYYPGSNHEITIHREPAIFKINIHINLSQS